MWSVTAEVKSIGDVPEIIEPHSVVVVVDAVDGRMKWLAFDCPCDTGIRTLLNVDANRSDDRFAWTLASKNPLTVYPSVDHRSENHKCHFTFVNGAVTWA